MADTIAVLMEANLLGVFNERDDERRAEMIPKTYAPEVTWADDEGVTTGHDELQDKAKNLLARVPGLEFSKAGPVLQTHGLGYLAWNLGPRHGDPVVTGFDVAIVEHNMISQLYTVVIKE